MIFISSVMFAVLLLQNKIIKNKIKALTDYFLHLVFEVGFRDLTGQGQVEVGRVSRGNLGRQIGHSRRL